MAGHAKEHAADHGSGQSDDIHAYVDHGAIQGLGDDDHGQYLNNARHDITARHTLGSVVPHDAHGNLTGVTSDQHHAEDHASRHQNGGDDEVNVGSLSGELADLQKPKDHTHQSAGSGVGGKLDHGAALNGLSDDDHTQYSLADGSRAFTGEVGGVTPTSSSKLATKGYVDTVATGLDWQDSVMDILDDPPGVPGAGDRYLIGTGTGAWVGKDDNIAEWNGVSWDFTAPNEGMCTWVEDENLNYVYNGAAWVKMGTTIDHGELVGLADDDHSQYHNDTRGDARYYKQTEFVTTATAGSPVKLDGDGNIDAAQINDADIDHGSIGGLEGDDHTQYTKADGTRAFTGDQSMGTHKLTSLTDGSADSDAINMGQHKKPPYVSQAAEPGVANGEHKVWHDSTNGKWWYIFGTDGTAGGNKKVELV